MGRLNLCKQLLKGIQKRITSPEYLQQFRCGKHFTRNRKLSMTQVITYLFYSEKSCMNLNISNIRDALPKLHFPDITKQALSKARKGISPQLFRDLFHYSSETFYRSNLLRKDWKGYFPFAIDGSRIQVPTTKDNLSYFGMCRNGSHSREDSMASISLLYDVCNDLIADGVIHNFNHGERSSATEHLQWLEDHVFTHKALILCDRGYASYEMYHRIQEKGYYFLIRVQEKVKALTDRETTDEIIYYVPDYLKKKGSTPVPVRVLCIDIGEGVKEWLVTNLLDPTLTLEDFKKLYFLRWGVESKYHEIKSQLLLEEFHGARHESVEQEFFLCMLFANLAALIKADADELIRQNASSKNKYQYQANRAYVIGRLKKKLPHLLCAPRKIGEQLEALLKEAAKRRSQIQPNRKNKRPRIQLRKRHLNNQKPCI